MTNEYVNIQRVFAKTLRITPNEADTFMKQIKNVEADFVYWDLNLVLDHFREIVTELYILKSSQDTLREAHFNLELEKTNESI